jgi:hypothetical protein
MDILYREFGDKEAKIEKHEKQLRNATTKIEENQIRI